MGVTRATFSAAERSSVGVFVFFFAPRFSSPLFAGAGYYTFHPIFDASAPLCVCGGLRIDYTRKGEQCSLKYFQLECRRTSDQAEGVGRAPRMRRIYSNGMRVNADSR